jgi:hypothetical protein
MGSRSGPRYAVPLAIGSALLLSLFTVYLHAKELGRAYIDEYQIPRHLAMLAGHAGNPWQYRMLSAWIVEAVHQLFTNLAWPQPFLLAFLAVRVAQETLMFLVAWRYWGALGLSSAEALMGLAVLGWSVSYSTHGSDLQFNTYFDVLFYLLAALAVLRGRAWWVVPITLLAALNRETSGFIPLLPLVADWGAPERRTGAIRVAAAGMAIYLAVFVGLRLAYGPQHLILPYGHKIGLDLLAYNLGRSRTWVQLMGTFNIVPVLALMAYARWPQTLRRFFWLVVPAWFLVHWVGAVMEETRLLLVPMALVFVPGALLLLRREASPSSEPAAA